MRDIDSTRADRTESFRTTQRSFLVTYDVDFTDDQNANNSFDLEIRKGSRVVESETSTEDGPSSFRVLEQPGTFTVEADVEPDRAATYEVFIEECTGEDDGTPGGNGGGGNGGGGNDNGGDLDCDDFDSQAEAQAEFDADTTDPNNLDADDDDEACEEFDYSQTANNDGNDGQYDDEDGDVDDPDDVVAGTGDDDPLPDTGGTPLLFGAAALALAAALLARRILAP